MVTRHALSFDVENWFDGNLHRKWTYTPDRRDNRLVDETLDLLDLLSRYGTRATFFILGRVARAYPDLIRRIAAAGHEVGCHGLEHKMLHHLRPAECLAGLRECRTLLQDLTGQPITGHRAPSWSVDPRVPWATEVLLDAGFSYDSSIFPMATPLYGMASAPASPFWLCSPGGGSLLELPPAVRRLGPLSIPYAGGFYWRVLPLPLITALLSSARTPQVTYLHPWELNPLPLRLGGEMPLLPRLVLRYGVTRAKGRLERLLARFSFAPMADLAQEIGEGRSLPILTLAGD